MAKAYRPVLVYTFSKRKKAKEYQKHRMEGNTPYPTRELADKESELMLETLLEREKKFEQVHNRTSNFKLLDVIIEEYELEDYVEVSGRVSVTRDYDYYAAKVGNQDILDVLETYEGRSIMVTIQLLN